MEKSKSEYPKIVKGTVKSVQSGDFITIKKTVKGKTSEYSYSLAGIQAPKVAFKERGDEPYGFEAWELLWKWVIGKKCEFHVEYKAGEWELGTLFVNEENINLLMAGSGFVRVLEKKHEGMAVS